MRAGERKRSSATITVTVTVTVPATAHISSTIAVTIPIPITISTTNTIPIPIPMTVPNAHRDAQAGERGRQEDRHGGLDARPLPQEELTNDARRWPPPRALSGGNSGGSGSGSK